jgi:hypothetical protein
MSVILNPPQKQVLRPVDLARRYGCAVSKILHFIRIGELVALNLSMTGKRARWVIRATDVELFERRRSNQTVEKPTNGHKRTKKPEPTNGAFFPES